jgi:hypothetical protein
MEISTDIAAEEQTELVKSEIAGRLRQECYR